MMMIEITIISSRSVNPASRILLPFNLPVTVLLPIQCGVSRLGPHVKNIFTAPRARIMRIERRAQFPIGLSRHRVNRQAAHVNFLLRGQLAANVRCLDARLSKTTRAAARHYIDAVDQRLEIRWVVIRIINSKDRAIADYYLTARINILASTSRRHLTGWQCNSGANHADGVAMKLINRRANLAQRLA